MWGLFGKKDIGVKYQDNSSVLRNMEHEAQIVPMDPIRQNERISETIRSERDRVLRYIKRFLPDEEEAEDMLQDVFYQLVETYRLMKPVERVSAWLFTVARNKLTDRYRKKKPLPFSAAAADSGLKPEVRPDPGPGPEMELWRKVFAEELEMALEELPAAQREAFSMHEIEGYSFREMAELTGANINTLITRKRIAVLHLRRRLRALYDDFVQEG